MESSIITKLNTQAFDNLTRKLNEANSRIVEFEEIKKGHLEFVKQKDDTLKEVKSLLWEIRTALLPIKHFKDMATVNIHADMAFAKACQALEKIKE